MIEFEIKRTGMLIIISAPSGGGKSTILRALLDLDSSLSYSVSATTRPSRSTEEHGKDYFFYQQDEFERLRDEGAFYEHAMVHGNYYGTLRTEVDAKLNAGKDVLLDVDVQGSLALKQDHPDCTTIFILPPSIAMLERRLRGRASDTEEVIQRRLANARGEVRMADRYDYILVNRELDETIQNVRLIIKAQRFRSSRITLKDSFGSVLASAASGQG
ncbi:guanylate kinase [soil metagenome]